MSEKSLTDRFKTIRMETMLELFPVSRQTLWRAIKAGEFPIPIKIGHTKVWLEKDVEKWFEAKISGEKRKARRDASNLV